MCVYCICGFDLTTDTPACLSLLFFGHIACLPFSDSTLFHIATFVFPIRASPFLHISHFACSRSSPLLFLGWSFRISCAIKKHLTLFLCCTFSQLRLTIFLLLGECGGWDVIGWGPYGKHSWYLLSSLLPDNFWESSSTRGEKLLPFLSLFLFPSPVFILLSCTVFVCSTLLGYIF